MILSELLGRLDNVRRGGDGGFTASCKCGKHAHGDKSSSLSIRGAGEKIALARAGQEVAWASSLKIPQLPVTQLDLAHFVQSWMEARQ